MTSSFIIKNLDKRQDLKNRSVAQNPPLGGMEDTYFKLLGNCHPDFTEYPVGKREHAPKVCVRRSDPGTPGKEIGTAAHKRAKRIIETQQGFRRGSVDMYDTSEKYPNQPWNPQNYHDRRIPWESDLLKRDYLRWEINFSGTGINTYHIPAELDDAGKPYYQYGYSFTPEEDKATGNRIATSPNDTLPPAKWDVTRLHQPYTVWKREHEFVGNPQNHRDATNYRRIV